MNNAILPTPRDVLNGRGQGVQRHPGNVKYRKLVFVNKGLYAKCPRADKIKISRGIVAAIRQSGGRFLEHDERKDTYFDIGDKKATEKTSQALREGQKDIRQNLYKEEEAALACSTGSADTKPVSNVTVTMPDEPEHGKKLPPEDYSQYSLLVLEALYNSDRSLPAPPAAPTMPQPHVQHQPPPLPPPAPIPNQVMYGVGITPNAYLSSSSAAMAMALDQFPGARMPAQPMPQAVHQSFDPRAQMSLGQDYSNPSFRLTDMSLGSVLSIRQLVESCRNTGFQPNGNRGTMDSLFSAGTMEMIRQSQLELNQIDQMEYDELTPSQGEIDAFFDRNSTGSDRISDMRFSDLSKERFTDFQDRDKGRLTDSSESTKNTSVSGNSYLTGQASRDVSSTDSDMAQLLLGLAKEGR